MDYDDKYTKHCEQLYEWILVYNAISPVKNKPKNYLIVHNVQSSRINVTKQQNITSNDILQLHILMTFNSGNVYMKKKIKIQNGPNKDVDSKCVNLFIHPHCYNSFTLKL